MTLPVQWLISQPAGKPPPEIPICDNCLTSEYLLFEAFSPGRLDRQGQQAEPGQVTYSCTECDFFAGHEVPAGWTPPGWVNRS